MTFKTLLLSSAVMAASTPALAQTDRPPLGTPTTVSEVVVSGRRTGADLALGSPATFLETPASVSTVQTTTLLEQGGTTLLDALRNVPGAQADLSFVGRPLELQLNIENLLDEDYFAGSHVHVSRYILPGQGRNASVSLSYRF